MVAEPHQTRVLPTPAAGSSAVLGRFSRITSAGRNFIPQIDGLRFVAIMTVICYHVRAVCLFHFGLDPTADPAQQDIVSRVFASGHYGVQLFFAISGFILCLPFARQILRQDGRMGLREYYLRRVTRIEPPYVIHLGFLFVLCVLVFRRLPSHPFLFHNPEWLKFTLAHISSSLAYSNGLIFGRHPYPNYVLWSLEVEVQFYLLAPFLAKMFWVRKTLHRRTLFVFLILALSLAASLGQPYRIWASLAGNLQYFLVGFLLADLYVREQLESNNRSRWWDLAFLVSCASVVAGEGTSAMMLLLPWAAFVCCLASFRGVVSSQLLANRWITTIGGMCYTIYMYHSLLISALVRLTRKTRTHQLSLDLLIQFALISVAIVPICAVLFAFLERPFMRRDWPSRVCAAIRRKRGPGSSVLQTTHRA